MTTATALLYVYAGALLVIGLCLMLGGASARIGKLWDMFGDWLGNWVLGRRP